MKKIIGICAALLLCASVAMAETSIKVDGSTTVLPIMQKIVEAYMKAHPDVKISVSGGGSGNGIKALIDCATDIAMASRAMEAKEIEHWPRARAQSGPDHRRRRCIVPVVKPATSCPPSPGQLKDMYTGKITSWKDWAVNVRWSCVPRHLSGPTRPGSTWVMKRSACSRALMQASNGAVARPSARTRNAIGLRGPGLSRALLKGSDRGRRRQADAEDRTSQEVPHLRVLTSYTTVLRHGAAVKGLVDFLRGRTARSGQGSRFRALS
jgi:phosphate transport system substrate-binding protein